MFIKSVIIIAGMIKLDAEESTLYKQLKAQYEELGVILEEDNYTFRNLVAKKALFHTGRNYFRFGMPVELDAVADAESLNWGNPIVPKTAKSRAKGNYWLCKQKDKPEFLKIQEMIEAERSRGGHAVVIGGHKYWWDFRGKCLARRPDV